MPAAFLPSFSVFEANDFHIGGDVGQVEDTHARWVQAARGLEQEQSHLAGIDVSNYSGSEGAGLAELVNSVYASRVGSAGQAMQLIADAIDGYGKDLAGTKTAMETLTSVAFVHHGAVNLAAQAVNMAELALKAAIVTGNAPAITAAKAHLLSCETAYADAKLVWEGDLTAAADIKTTLGGHVDARVSQVETAHSSYMTGAAGFGGRGGSSDSWEAAAGLLTQISRQVQDSADHVEAYGTKIVSLSGADDVHGARMVGAVARQHMAWLDQIRQLADKIAALSSAIARILRLIEQWDQSSGDRVSSVMERIGDELKKYDWESFFKTYIPTNSDYALTITNLGIDSPVAAAKLQAEILEESAVGAAKNVSWVKAPALIGRGTPVLGAALGSTVDIKQGMDPKLAIGSNVAGAAAGAAITGPATVGGTMLAGALMGASAGSAVPVVGTVIGLAVGAGVGYFTTKTIQGAAKL